MDIHGRQGWRERHVHAFSPARDTPRLESAPHGSFFRLRAVDEEARRAPFDSSRSTLRRTLPREERDRYRDRISTCISTRARFGRVSSAYAMDSERRGMRCERSGTLSVPCLVKATTSCVLPSPWVVVWGRRRPVGRS